MTTVRIAPLVEGDGEVAAVPVLLRRIILAIDPSVSPAIAAPFRHPSGRIWKPNGLERAMKAVAAISPGYAVLLLIDSDDGCPVDLGAKLRERATKARPDVQVSVVLAHREYEAWFLASAESLAGKRNLRLDLSPPSKPEDIRGAKDWLSKQMPKSMRYSPTQDQAALSQLMDLEIARDRSRSFRKLWKEVYTILANNRSA